MLTAFFWSVTKNFKIPVVAADKTLLKAISLEIDRPLITKSIIAKADNQVMRNKNNEEKKALKKNQNKKQHSGQKLDKNLILNQDKEKESDLENQAPQKQKSLKKTERPLIFAADINKKAELLFGQLPEIPADLRRQAFSTKAVARFYIAADGSVLRVELIKPSASLRLNQLLLKNLKNWKFAARHSASTQDIAVNFLVK
jgi:TonB family protein